MHQLAFDGGLEPVATYAVLARQYGAPRVKGPLNLGARRDAGFDDAELALLKAGLLPTSAPANR